MELQALSKSNKELTEEIVYLKQNLDKIEANFLNTNFRVDSEKIGKMFRLLNLLENIKMFALSVIDV